MQSILGKIRRVDVTFHKSGRIDLAAHVVRLLEISEGDSIDIVTDGYEYYLYVAHKSSELGRFHACCYPTNKRGNHFRTYSKHLTEAILRECQEAKKVGLMVGELRESGGAKHLPLITRNH